MQKKLKIIPLGGVEEIGINCTALQYQDQIIVIDFGLAFPLSNQYGVDYVIPNIDYLQRNQQKIEAIIITHAHLDHIGALPYILEPLNFPEIFASRFAIELIKEKLTEHKLLDKVKIREVNKDSQLVSGSFEIRFFGVNHSIPESMGVIVKTPVGNIVHTGDFKFDNSPENEPVADYSKIAAIGEEGVLALLSDSTNSFVPGFSKSEHVIAQNLEEIVKKAQGRVIISTFSSLVTRLYQLIKIAEKLNKKVAIVGRSMETAIRISREIGFINVSPQIFIPKQKIGSYKDNELMILATGAQGDHMAALTRIARDEHPNLHIKKGDTVIMSASIIPGNDMLVQVLMDNLSMKGAFVFHHEMELDMDLHSSGHGYQEDQKLMLNLTKPQYFIPVHGFQSFLFKHGQTAQSVGIPEKNIILPTRGAIIELNSDGWQIEKFVKATPVLVSGSKVGDVGPVVLLDREQLANYGVVVINLQIDKASQQLRKPIEVISRGFVYVKESGELMQQITQTATNFFEKHKTLLTDEKRFRSDLTSEIKKLLYNETQREPLILLVMN